MKHDGIIKIAVGRNRKELNWKNKEMKWSEFLDRVSKTTRTPENYEEYKKLSKNEQDDIKDVGGFVGGALKDGRRKSAAVLSRSILTLDADYGQNGLWDTIEMLFDFGCCIYTTHKHSKDKPRFRLVIPLSRTVTPEEYGAVSRRIAADIGIDYFDDTTYEPSRLMYWPSTSQNGEFIFKYQDEEWLNPDDILSRYENWQDTSFWPESSRSIKIREKSADKQGNPREKGGIVGAFCRTYSVVDAIEKFLSDTYVPCADENRYTYVKGSTSGGLVIYENGDFAYSHHGTDPASGKLCNAFDLVRLHKFGELDEDVKGGTPVVKLPSYQAMMDFSRKDEEVKQTIGQEKLSTAKEDFIEIDDSEVTDTEWLKLLEVDKRGFYKPTIGNIVLILENDPYLKEKIALNEFSHRTIIRGNLPWHRLKNTAEGDPWKDSDDAALRYYIEKVYGITSPTKISDALLIVEEKNKYHPIRDYLEEIKWDGQKRVETLFIDYLGAEDTSYTRTVTRKAIVAAVARVFVPGIKFDYMLVLVGKQGIGKSHIISLLGQNWYSDSLNTVQGKEAYEQLQDAWIIEMAELSATKKAETEAVKHFISKREDIYRVAYGKRVTKFPRQCVFFGTTNDNDFLRDKTGNRRYWPVVVAINKSNKNLWKELSQDEIDQIWAETLTLWRNGEGLFLSPDIEKEAVKVQEQHTEESSKEGLIREYLDRLLPKDWGKLDIGARRLFIHGTDFGEAKEGTVQRDKVCAMEIWVELFQADPKQLSPIQAREINDILRKIEGWKEYSKGTGRLKFGRNYGLQRAFIRETYP
ncbi:phage-like protein [Clostridium sp. DMHC 10]|uniref:virulence-associated E family protein n=1 Tax=Clostridium sp. DMHC 10 TaxID=747377 RepID=UPI00069ED6C1|nr:virulence-associated E family protein [Clostridium sp. DMHC 10]KOF56138.1 phage-like protein [Clostridium sp. DMHC 10]